MSIATTVRTAGPFAGTGSLVALPFAFKVFTASDLVVQRTNVAGDVATLTLTTHYSVSLNADQDTSPGGTVTLVTALAVGETAALTSGVSATQPLQLASGGPFLPGQIEDALDRAMIVVQQQGVLGEQTLRVPLGETALILPSADQRANKALLFDADGDPYLAAPASGSAADVMLQYASTDAGKGASLVGVADAGGYFAGANVEGVLQEIGAATRLVLSIDDYPFSAVGDGSTNDRDAIRAAIAYAKLNGVGLVATPGKTYYLGTFPVTVGESKFTIDFDGFNFDPRGATFTVDYTDDAAMSHSVKQCIFDIRDAGDITIGDFAVTADGINKSAGSAIGVVAAVIHPATANKTNIHFGDIRGTRLLSPLTIVSDNPATARTRGITFRNLYNTDGYYGLNCAENGDSIRGRIHTNNCLRSYFVYGITDHQVHVFSTNHSSFTDVLIKRYTRDTSAIHVKYVCASDNSSNAAISFEHQNDTDDGKIENVTVEFDVTKSVAANPTVNFTAFTLAGSTRTSTASRTDNIRLIGKTNSTVPITLTTAIGGTNGENISRLYVQRQLLAGLSDYKRYLVKDSEQRYVARSNAAGGMVIRFNVSEFKYTPNWGLLTVWGGDNPGASSAEYIIRQMFVLFTVPSDGSTAIGATTTIATQTAGALGPTITIPAQTNTFDLTVNVNNYTHANRQCSATLEVFRIS